MQIPYFDEQTVLAAKGVHLYDFVLDNHSNSVLSTRDSLRLLRNQNIVVYRGFPGFMECESGYLGDSVEYLNRFMRYPYLEAVAALCAFAGIPCALRF